MAVAARCGQADDGAVIDGDRFTADGLVVAAFQFQIDDLAVRAVLFALLGRGLAQEILVEFDEAFDVGLDRRDFVGQFGAPAAIGLFHAHGIDGIGAEMADIVGLPGLHQGGIDRGHAVHRAMQFPAQFTDIVDAQRPDGDACDGDVLRRQPAEALVRQVRIGDLGQDVAAFRAGEDKVAPGVGHVFDRHGFTRFDMLGQPIHIADFRRGGGQDVIAVLRQPGHGRFAFDHTVGVQHMGQRDAADLLRHAVGEDAVQHGGCVRAGNFEFREGRQVGDRDFFHDMAAFRADRVEGVVVAEARFFVAAVGGIILHPFPARRGGVETARLFQRVVKGGFALAPARRSFFTRQVQDVHVLVVFDRPGADVIFIRPAAETARVQASHVDFGFAVDHPLRQIFTATGPLRDADGRAAALPEILQAAGRAQQRVGVGRMRNGAVDDALHAAFAPDFHAFQHLFQPGGDAVQLVREQLVLAVPFGIAAAVRPGFLRAFGFVDADQARLLFLTIIGRGPGIADDRHFGVGVDELLHRVGDDIMVLHIRDRHVGPDPLVDLPGIAAAGIDHMLTGHGAFFRHHLPFAGGQLLDVDHPVAAFDFRAHVARALGQRVTASRRIDMPVIQGPGGGENPGRIDMREDGFDFVRPDDLHAEADQLRRALDFLEVVQLRLVHREAQPAAAMPGHILPRHGLQLRIQRVSVVMDFRHVVIGDEAGALARRVPGGAGGQFPLFDQQGVRPPLLRQMIQQAAAHHPAADNHHPRMFSHGRSPFGVRAGVERSAARLGKDRKQDSLAPQEFT